MDDKKDPFARITISLSNGVCGLIDEERLKDSLKNIKYCSFRARKICEPLHATILPDEIVQASLLDLLGRAFLVLPNFLSRQNS